MQKRKDLYIEVHKGLRKGLMNIMTDAGRLDVENDEQLIAFVDDLNDFIELLSGHADHENKWIGPHLITIDKELADTIEAEHVEDKKLTQSLKNEYKKLLELDREQRSLAGDKAYILLADFVGWYFRHMSKEEQVIMSILQAKLSDKELMDIEHQLVGGIPPNEMNKYMELIIPSTNPEELRVLFGGMKHHAPPEAFEGACSLAESLLQPDDWRSLKDFLDSA